MEVPTSQKTLHAHYKEHSAKAVHEIKTAVYFKNHTKRLRSFYRQNGESLYVPASGAYSNHCALRVIMDFLWF
jgi:homogentisate 1,2-dioxygenase